ncbi:MAG TPA: hypothetical protein VK607_03640 [Kofleriaceae bacterium]|nr:hypothetical protein [Kofleriaceae bacterium]
MSPRAIALAGVLQHELIRVGRPEAAVTVGADERTVTLADADGVWQGPLPVAMGALVVFGDGEGSSAQFWQQFAPAPSPSA